MKIKIKEIKDLLSKNNISYDTNIKDDETLDSISSILNANSNALIFLFNDKYSESLQQSKAKCCILEKKYVLVMTPINPP